MHKYVRLLGLLSSWGVFFFMIFYLILLCSPLFVQQENIWKPSITTYYKTETSSFMDIFGYYVYFSTAPLIIILFSCFHAFTPPSRKIFTGIALSLIIISTSLRIVGFIGQIEINHFRIDTGNNQRNSFEIYKFFSNMVSRIYWISTSILPGLAQLALIPAFLFKNRIERQLKIVLLISAFLNLLSALPFRTAYHEKSVVMLLMSQIFMMTVMIFSIIFFRQIKTKEYEE